MGIKWRLVVAGLWLWLGMAGSAQSASAEEDIKAALHSTGVSASAASVSELIRSGLETRRTEQMDYGVSAATEERLATLMNQAYAAERIEQRMIAILAKGYDRNRVRLVNQTMNSDRVRQLRELEEKLREQADKHGGLSAKGDQPASARLALYQKLDKARGASELRAGAQALAVLVLLDALAAAKAEPLPLQNAGFDERLGMFYNQMIEPSRAEVMVLYHAAYRELGDDVINQVAQLYGNRATQWFISEGIDALIAAVRDIDTEVRAALAKAP